MILAIRVIPRASKASVAVEPDGSLKVRLQSPPVEGAANAELIDVLARAFQVPRRAVAITGGSHSRVKRVQIDGVDELPAAIAADGGRARRPPRTPRR